MSETLEATKPDAVFVLQREANGEPFLFEYEGESYSIPHVRDMDVFSVRELLASATDEDSLIWSLFSESMGEAQWSRLRAQGIPQRSFPALVAAWREHCGLGTGESSASSE